MRILNEFATVGVGKWMSIIGMAETPPVCLDVSERSARSSVGQCLFVFEHQTVAAVELVGSDSELDRQ